MSESGRTLHAITRRRFLGLAAASAGAMTLGGPFARSVAEARPRPPLAPEEIARDVRREFLRSWGAYKEFAFGHDNLKPVSGTSEEFFFPNHPLGLTIIESLDTLYLMGLDRELDVAVGWIENNLDFDIDGYIQVFEANIRLVGGLLAGYHVTGNQRLLDLARDLADRLLPAFTKSPTGINYRFVNLKTGDVRGADNFLAEIGTYIAEFGDLSELVGDPRYYGAAKAALKAVYDQRSKIDLLAATINAETGKWRDNVARIGPPVDSYFEYLWDGYALFGDTDLLRWYNVLTNAIFRYQAERFGGHLWFKRVDFRTGELVDRGQSELASFYAGLLAESGRVPPGRAYHDSWKTVVDRYELPPEFIDYSDLSAPGRGYRLRPEYLDSALFLYLKTGDELYRERAYEFYENQKEHCRVENGYTVLEDVTTAPKTKGDLTPGYWWSENMKYFYLIFADEKRFDYENNYLTTEGNVLRGIRRGPRVPGRSQRG